MAEVKVLVLAGDGINCENETAKAFESESAKAEIISVNQLIGEPEQLLNYQIFALPGGFSFGDEIQSGQILALKLNQRLKSTMDTFIKNKGLVIGICNGFQVLMKWNLFAPTPITERQMTLAANAPEGFINRWESCQIQKSNCIWTQGLENTSMPLPIRHGEGRILFSGESSEHEKMYQQLKSQGQVVMTYHSDPNGSYGKIAGLCDTTGQVFGLMPHPEAAIHSVSNPYGDPLKVQLIFKNAIKYASQQQRSL